MCFLIGATGPGVTSTGEALLGGVSDDPYLFRTFVRVVLPAKASSFAHIGSELQYVKAAYPQLACSIEGLPPPFEVEPGQPSRGINAAGLAFTCALAVEQDTAESGLAPPRAAAPQPFAKLSRRLMAECSTVGDAVALLLAAGAVAPAFSVLVADAAGELAQVEVGAFGSAVHKRYSKETPGIVVVPFNRPEGQLSHEASNNGCRLRRGWELAESLRGRLDVHAFTSILADHENRARDSASNPLIPWWGHSICNHGTRISAVYDPMAPPWGTVSSEILQPSLRALHYCYGWPCGERAEFGDQLFQSSSWGHFLGFALPPPVIDEAVPKEGDTVIHCTTVDGAVTAQGQAFRSQVASHLLSRGRGFPQTSLYSAS
mmetsp:Transcript_141785/g.395324  ORF Transcript_141785/g.395324 Transcript_141785/m.395324 type:complete len:374 (+) Transcript_141785:70-1191(+)